MNAPDVPSINDFLESADADINDADMAADHANYAKARAHAAIARARTDLAIALHVIGVGGDK